MIFLKKTKRLQAQTHFNWGDGIMNRTHSALMADYSDEISWYAKKQEYTWLSTIQEKII